MITFPHGDVFSLAYIDSNPLPQVSKDLLPWLVKDRREAEEGAMVKATNKDGKTETTHNKEGLHHAERELRRIQSALAEAQPQSDRATILRKQEDGMQQRVDFWRGKCHLLDRVIAATKALP